MEFNPKPDDRLSFGDDEIEFLPLADKGKANIFVYSEAGKEGKVYKVRKVKSKGIFAFKVFHSAYRTEYILHNSEKLRTISNLNGLRVANRTLITNKTYPRIISLYPVLEYAVLMPWIQGNIWGNYYTDGDKLSTIDHLHLLQNFSKIMVGLEEHSVAHCDLSNQNILVVPNPATNRWVDVQLVDVESMFSPDIAFPEKNLSFGTDGYRNKWIAEHGLWEPAADRFAFGILCIEILMHANWEIWCKRSDDSSFFNEKEIGENSNRYELVMRTLEEISSEIAYLYNKTWHGEKPIDFPKIAEWDQVIQKISSLTSPQTGSSSSPLRDNGYTNFGMDGENKIFEVKGGLPPRMVINTSIIDLGIIDQSGTSTTTINNALVIKNDGGSTLIGKVITDPWINFSPSSFSIEPGKKQIFSVTIVGRIPKSLGNREIRLLNCIRIESNDDIKILGIKASFPKPPFYKIFFCIIACFLFFFLLLAWINLSDNTNLYIPALFETDTVVHVSTRSPTLSYSRTPTRTPTRTSITRPRSTPTTRFGIGSSHVRAMDGMVMMFIPEGEFTMGSNIGNVNEQPEHRVYLDAFWMDQTEISNAMYRMCVNAHVCRGEATTSSLPVIGVSWNDAQTYCRWAGGRLPTEAEWEKAARGTDGRIYPWGENAINSELLANFDTNNERQGNSGSLASVFAFADGASPYGLLNMAGNVWEWVADWYDETYYQNSPTNNPIGPTSGTLHVLRGGAAYNLIYFLRSSVRIADNPEVLSRFYGFRCVWDTDP